jgi:20S proteasome subunit alpha 7
MRRGTHLRRQDVTLLLYSLCLTHEESRDKKYEFELSWVCQKSNNVHQFVPQQFVDAAVERAQAAIDE